MSTPTEAISKSTDFKEESPGFLERIGVKYYRYLSEKYGTSGLKNVAIDDLPPDNTLTTLASNITAFAAVIGFGIGGLTTFVTIWIEWTYQASMETVPYYFLYGFTLVVMLVLEMAVLFWLGLKTVYSLACLSGHNQSNQGVGLPGDDEVPNLLARAALEVPDPVIHYLGIDPLKHLSKSKLLLVTFLYKAKVILSTVLVKFILVRLVGKGEVRLAVSWLGVPITGFWDAFTLYKVAREARLRLFGNKLAEHIVNNLLTDEFIEQLSPKCREGAIRAVATMMVLAQNYHPNMLMLLVKLCNKFKIDQRCEYDNWEDFLALLDQVETHERYFLLDLLCVSAAFDGHLSRLERHHLPEAFKELTDVYMARSEALTKQLMNGQLHAAKVSCTLDFVPG